PRPIAPAHRGRASVAHRRARADHLLHGAVTCSARTDRRLDRADDRRTDGPLHASAAQSGAQGDRREGASVGGGEGGAPRAQGRLLWRDRRRGGGAVALREEGGDRRVRGSRHRGHPTARGGGLPGHRDQRLLRRRPLPGRHEGVREGMMRDTRKSLLGNQRGEVIPGATLRTDAWWIEQLLVVLVLGAFAVYATWAALQNAYYYAAPYLSPFYSPCLSTNCQHVSIPIIGSWWNLSPAFLILWIPGGF